MGRLGDAGVGARAVATTSDPPVGDVPACTNGDSPARPDPDGDWVLAIVDTELRLPDGYVPPDLVRTARAGIRGGGLIRRIVVPDLRTLVRDARSAGVTLAIQSAYRSAETQADVFADWVAQDGLAAARRGSARAGHSEHQLGTTLDLRAEDGPAPWTIRFDRTTAGRWIADHAAEHGFVISYPKGAMRRTCYHFEPWHVRWVGRDVASRIVASGLTPREWLYRFGNDPERVPRKTR